MLRWGSFVGHSGIMLPFKVELDDWEWGDWECAAQVVRSKFAFSRVIGVPTGGMKFARHLPRYCVHGYPTLIVDDVLTTGGSMEELRRTVAPRPGGPTVGVVAVARGPCPNWVWAMLTLNEWTQCRGTGTG